MKFVVEATGVADGLPVCIPAPERGGVGPAVGAARPLPLGGTQPPLGLHQRPVGPVHLVVEAAGVAEIVAVAVPPPERGGGRPAVDALPTLWKS